jgi:magnesium transporter
MALFSTFYISRIQGHRVLSDARRKIGVLQDLIVDLNSERPKVIAAKIKIGYQSINVDFSNIEILKEKGKYVIICKHIEEMDISPEHTLVIGKNILDKQIVDIDGRKLVRVNDIRLVMISTGTFIIAVDVGVEGLFRRLSIAKPLNKLIKPFGRNLPSNLILWDDVATINFENGGIKLSKTQEKLSTLHPSDLADIIEDLDRQAQLAVFNSLNEEQAADVLEEMETDAQVSLLENMPKEKAADVLEKMPADEVADILDELDDEKMEELLGEMEAEASKEVRELMEYPDNTVGSLMSTDYISFKEDMTVEEAINELRRTKPESNTIYYLYVLDNFDRLIATVSLRDMIVAAPDIKLKEIMNSSVIDVEDYDKFDSLGEIITKYNLLAIPVINRESQMMGIVIIDDVVYTLLKSRKRKAMF